MLSLKVVISGDFDFVTHVAETSKKDLKIRKAAALEVSAPFHSPLMLPAAKRVEEELRRVGIRDSALPLISNVDGSLVSILAQLKLTSKDTSNRRDSLELDNANRKHGTMARVREDRRRPRRPRVCRVRPQISAQGTS